MSDIPQLPADAYVAWTVWVIERHRVYMGQVVGQDGRIVHVREEFTGRVIPLNYLQLSLVPTEVAS